VFLLAKDYKNNPTAEYRMEGLLYADMNMGGAGEESVINI
jgi:hypothetical protein